MTPGTGPRPALAPFDALLGALDLRADDGSAAADRLGAMLHRTLAGSAPRRLSVEPSAWFSTGGGATGAARPESPAGAAVPPQFRVFRREAPVAAHGLPLASPDWGRGAAVAETLGPFPGVDGRLFWFDFFPLIRLIPVFLAGDARPALLIDLHPPGHGPISPVAVHEALGLSGARPVLLRAGSLWVRADLLAPAAPAGTYVGLRINGGRLSFHPRPAAAGVALTIPAGGRCEVHLDLRPAVPTPAAGGQAGRDAAEASLALPSTFAFVVSAGHHSVTQLSHANWTLYGQHVDFTWRHGTATTYVPDLLSVVVPLSASVPMVQIGAAASPLATPAGEAPVVGAGWTLPVAAIDVSNPTEAAGGGGLAVRTGPGLTLGWRGLRDGPLRLPSPWLMLTPGRIMWTDARASDRYATQTLRLWKDADSRHRSELKLRYPDPSVLSYHADASGSEVIVARANAEARLDRPVDVKGTPFPIHTIESQVVLGETDTLRFVSVYDDNILADALDPHATWPAQAGGAVSMAIRNALFTVTPVNSLFLFGRRRDDETIDGAVLLLGMGLYGLLPSLPDPYAADVGWLRRQGRDGPRDRQGQVILLLVAEVVWTKAAADTDPDGVVTRFAFAPAASAADASAAWAAAASRETPTTLRAEAARLADAASGHSNQADWDRVFGGVPGEQFALLDVSGNADQMGVSFAWFDPGRVGRSDFLLFQTFGVRSAAGAAAPTFPLQVRDLDLSAEGRFVRAFTTPQMSWEPLLNATPPDEVPGDPPGGFNLYPDDGGPTRLLNNSVELVPIAPIPVTEFLVADFNGRADGFTGALFTLPFGLRAFAEFSRQNPFRADLGGARLALNRHEYEGGDLTGGLQIRADAPPHPAESPVFRGGTLQLNNVLDAGGSPTFAGTLGKRVGEIFNTEFFYHGTVGYNPRGVPLTRIDFSGYGASISSHWQNPNAAIAATSQAHFDVLVGRTAGEVVQVRSLLYPWGVHVVRTITIVRAGSAYLFRYDTGWQAESDGVYDFRYNAYTPTFDVVAVANPYVFHPGIVDGVFRVRNIRAARTVPDFQRTWVKNNGEWYVDGEGIRRPVTALTLPENRTRAVDLQPVYFDADVGIQGVTSGATGGRVPSKGMLGYVQIAPRGEPISPDLFAQLLGAQFNALGGPVDCVIDVAGSGQPMRLSRVDVNASQAPGDGPIFVTAARGTLVLPRDGSWSVVQHNQGTGEVSPLDPQAAVPLVRRGLLDSNSQTTDAGPGDLLRLANPADLVAAPGPGTRHYGLLQSTGTQKALFRRPGFKEGLDELLSNPPDFADAYRIVNSPGIFPNVQDALPLNLGAFKTKVIAEGYRLLDPADPGQVFKQDPLPPDAPLYLINETFLKLYVEYAKKDGKGKTVTPGHLLYGFDSSSADPAKKWLSKVNDIGMVVDLGPLTRLMMIRGKFDAEKGKAPAFIEPEIQFSESLQPVMDILQILLQLQGGDYKAALAKGLEIAMSNSAESWNYAFHARKEIPLVKFPPGALYDNPTNPLKLEAHMALGVYFNESVTPTGDLNQLVPSAGAFLEFGGRLSVMCVSLAAATVYATGSVDLRTAADVKTGPSLHMKFGFGAQVVVGLPVVGDVSILYMVGVEFDVDSTQITVSGFLLYRGHAELAGGLVGVTISIEAKGSVQRFPAQDRTDLIAQITFGLDISVFLVINISFSQSWQESRQIA